MTAKLLLKSLTVLALGCAVALVLGMVLHAPVAFAIVVWLVWPVVAVIMVVQLVTSHKTPRRRTETIVQHEDGSIEVTP